MLFILLHMKGQTSQEITSAKARRLRVNHLIEQRYSKYLILNTPNTQSNRIVIAVHVQVLFRYALAIFKCFEEKLLRQTDYMSIFNCFRAELQSLFDIKKLTKVSRQKRRENLQQTYLLDISTQIIRYCFLNSLQIAFHELNPFPLRVIKSKREHHHKILKVKTRI